MAIGPSPQGGPTNQFSVFNATVPKEGPKAIPYTCSFSSAQTVIVDLTQKIQLGVISMVQTLFIDNTANSADVTFTAAMTGQVITCPPNSQGYFPILVPNPAVITGYSTGGVDVPIQIMNTYSSSAVWSKTGEPFLFDSSGYLEVAAPNIEAAISGSKMQAQEFANGNGDTSRPRFNGNLAWSGSIAAGSTSATLTTGSPGFFITHIRITADETATLAAAGNVLLTVKDGSTTILEESFYVPASSAPATFINPILRMDGLQYNSGASGNTLTVTLGTALATGSIYYNFFGGITASLG